MVSVADLSTNLNMKNSNQTLFENIWYQRLFFQILNSPKTSQYLKCFRSLVRRAL